jgi:hypothetical protein
MALTTQQEQVAIAVGNAFVAAGFTTEASATAMLKRLKLEQDKRKLESAATLLRSQFATGTSQFNTALEQNQAAQAQIQATIDALPA